MKFGEMLLQKELITPEILEECLEHQRKTPELRIGFILNVLGYIKEEDIENILILQKETKVNSPNNKEFCYTEDAKDFSVQQLEYFKQKQYKLIKKIGRGGMGRVYLVYNEITKTNIALKIIEEGQDIRRLKQEYQLLSKLSHKNIIKVFDIEDKFFTMEYVDGVTLAEKIENNSFSLYESIKFFEKITIAVSEIHKRGIIHRDLTASNIMVDFQDEPKIMDFGLALTNNYSRYTLDGNIVGTGPYIPPEKIEELTDGKITPETAANDIYSLGVILYQMLTKKLPFTDKSPANLIYKIKYQNPESPCKENAKISKKIEIICLKCLEKQPKDRYLDTQQITKDLQRYLKGEKIQAKLPGVVRKTFRWFRQHYLVSTFTLFFLFVIFIGYQYFLVERYKNALFDKTNNPILRANAFRQLQTLGEIDFQSAPLDNTHFFAHDFKGVYLYLSSFRDANLARTNLEGANLREAKLINTNLTYANLKNVNFDTADLSEAHLYKAQNLVPNQIKNCNIQNIKGLPDEFFIELEKISPQSTKWWNQKNVDFTKVKVPANLAGANLKQSNFEKVDLSGISLNWANLSGANLKDTILDGTYLMAATLKNVKNLTVEQICQCNNIVNAKGLSTSFLLEVQKIEPRLTKWWYREKEDHSNQSRRGYTFIGVNLRRANFCNADLSHADLSWADVAEVNFSGAILKQVDLSNAKNLQANQLYSCKNIENIHTTTEILKQVKKMSPKKMQWWDEQMKYDYNDRIWK